jgi:hypothetical protein
VDALPHLVDQEYTMVSRTAAQLVKAVFTGLDDRYPAVRAYSEAQRSRTAEDIAHIVDFLATALYVDDSDLFTGFIGWTGDILAARGVPAASLLHTLGLLAGELREFPRAVRLVTTARDRLAADLDQGKTA